MKKGNIVAVVCGGPSKEAEVSRSTASCIATALRQRYETVHLLELDELIGERLRILKVDVVFPALHGPLGEDGSFQGFLEVLALPYVGSGVLASALAMDKVRAKALFSSLSLPLAPHIVVKQGEELEKVLAEVLGKLGSDVVIKPASQGSALGVSFGSSEETIKKAIKSTFAVEESLLVEKRIWGKETTVAVFENDGLEAFPVVEIKTPNGSWYDYEHRYTEGLSEHIIPAPYDTNTTARLKEIAMAAHEILGCSDLSRADFIVPEDGEPILLEVNTMPGMTPTSLYPDAAKVAGWSFPKLLDHFVERALARGKLARKGD